MGPDDFTYLVFFSDELAGFHLAIIEQAVVAGSWFIVEFFGGDKKGLAFGVDYRG